MTAVAGVLRGPKKGNSTLGGAVQALVYTVDQFDQANDWPTRVDAKAEIGAIPLLADNDAAVIIFDFDGQLHGKSTGNTSPTQFSFKHGCSGKVAGHTVEKNATLDEYMGQDLIVIKKDPQGVRTVYGSLTKPMRMKIDDDHGEMADKYVGSTVSFEQVDAVDFRPPILAAAVVLTANAIPAYA